MSKQQLRLLLFAGVTLALMIGSLFVVPWFKLTIDGLDLGGGFGKFEIDLRSVRTCGIDGTCVSVSLPMKGIYPTLAVIAFWSNCVLAIMIAWQAGRRILSGASSSASQLGYLLAIGCFIVSGVAGFMFGPETQEAPGVSITVVRTWGPAMLVGADLLALFVFYMAAGEVFDTTYTAPVTATIPRVPSSPIPRPATTPIPRPTTGPIPASNMPSTTSFKPLARPSSIPLDDSSDHTQPDPTPATMPERPPRTKAPSSVPFVTEADLPAAPILDPGPAGIAPSVGGTLGLGSDRSLLRGGPVGDQLPSGPGPAAEKPRPVLSFAVERATLSTSGISATLETADVKQVAWNDIVGIVARRLPADAPYDGETFVDVVSTAGSTLRVLPWSTLDGDLFPSGEPTYDGEERARALVQLVATRCPDAKLDGATRTFLGSRGHAAQLPNADTLAQHDARLA